MIARGHRFGVPAGILTSMAFACMLGCGRVDYEVLRRDGGHDGSVHDADAGLDADGAHDAADADAGLDAQDAADGEAAPDSGGGDGGDGGDVWSESCESDHGRPGCAPMVWMEGGTFELGQASVAEPVQSGEAAITVSSFYLDAYEVTVARFRAYVEGNGGTLSGAPLPWPVEYPAGEMGAGDWPGPQDALTSTRCTWAASEGTNEAHPINCVDWYTAMAFCVWDGGRLPTESEWEYAARGRSVAGTDGEGLSSGRTYPWGDTPDPTVDADDCEYANYYKTSSSTYCSSPMGTEPVGNSPNRESAGVWDLAGNVWEWTADGWGSYPAASAAELGNWASRTDPLFMGVSGNDRVVRGGAWSFSASSLSSAIRLLDFPVDRTPYFGLRCSRTAPAP